MQEPFLTFKKFKDEEVAEEFIERLKEKNIPYELEDNNKFFDPTFAANPLTREIRVKLQSQDFEMARGVVEDYYKPLLDDVESDYYLFDFTDQELTEIIMKPDEWGDFDYQLAQKILRDKGNEIKPEIVTLIRKQRNEDLAKPETSSRYVIILGYASTIFLGFFGILIGWHLAYSKKTLPDGKSVYRYRDNERNHGTRILIIAAIFLVIGLSFRWFLITRE